MKAALILLVAAMCGGCSVTVVYAPKTVLIKDSSDCGVVITGSDLKGNDANQNPTVKIPMVR